MLALCTYGALIALWRGLDSQPWLRHLPDIVVKCNQWFWLLAVLAWSARWLNRPSTWVRYANRRIYVWYILHQTFTILAGYYLGSFALGGVLEGALGTRKKYIIQ